jgi:hypothetical protein
MIAAGLAHPASIVIGARLRRVAAAPRTRRFANRFGASGCRGRAAIQCRFAVRTAVVSRVTAAGIDLPHDENAGFTLGE